MKRASPYKAEYATSWALVIGIDRYQHTSRLVHAKNDAEAVGEMLRDRFGFTNITSLLDAYASRDQIRKSFLKFTSVGPDDRVLVYFAGHGCTATGNRGEVGFFVPVDGREEDVDSLVRWHELTDSADLVPAKHVFFIIDTCYGWL